MNHHPVFPALSHVARFAPDSSLIVLSEPATTQDQITTGQVGPPLNEEYFEWIDLFESLRAARDRYVMIEVGAGYGRWGIAAGRLAKGLGLRDIDLRFIEAEPQHAAWAREHIQANGLGDVNIHVIEGAICYTGKPVQFAIDLEKENLEAHSWYGQMIVDWESPPPTEELYFGKVVHRSPGGYGQIVVDPVTFESVATDLSYIDLVDMDIQGAERELVQNAIQTLTEKVRIVHIGTHGHDIEDHIRAIFGEHGWTPRWDFACHGEHETPFGSTSFQDGVQSWANPRFS